MVGEDNDFLKTYYLNISTYVQMDIDGNIYVEIHRILMVMGFKYPMNGGLFQTNCNDPRSRHRRSVFPRLIQDLNIAS